MNDNIKNKIHELFSSTPKDISVGWGRKRKDGKFTGDVGFLFTVRKKKLLSELTEDEILPSSIEIDGITYSTDIIEMGKVKLFSCGTTVQNNCYNWYDGEDSIYIPNWDTIRPLKGGIQMTSYNKLGSVGTLGAMVIDNETESIVGLTNSHVVIGNPFFTSERDYAISENEEDDDAYQNYVGEYIGKVIRYAQLKKLNELNYVDGAIVALDPSVVDFDESFKQYGLSYSLPMEFATTEEIDNLLDDNPPLYSSGRSTGPKEGVPCGLIPISINQEITIDEVKDAGSNNVVKFGGCIVFTRMDPECPWPIFPGDSGSVLIADYDGVWKIIGLCFAGDLDTGLYGFACRIDKVAEELNISAWDGTPKNFIDLSSQEIITVNGTSSDKTIECDGKTYWQIGAGLTNNPCVE